MSTGTDSHPNFLRLFIPLLVLFVICTVLLYVADRITHARIKEKARDLELRIIDSVMPLAHDNDLHEDYMEIPDPDYFGGNSKVIVFRARKTAQPLGVVFMPVSARGYSGTILLAIGIADDGTLLGVRVVRHRETPGLGDSIEPGKSGWINNFTGRSFTDPPLDQWLVQADGGAFDQLSGATITSRGVVNAVRKTLDYFHAHHDRLY